VAQNSRFGGGRIYEEKKVPCWSCGAWFVLTVVEQKELDAQGREKMLRYCKTCRDKREARGD
jgi:hypothetical protein